jgi:dihydrofolate synthase/folylpolyglutamate synthase
MNYQKTLEYLYNCCPAFQFIGEKAYKPGLTNTIRLDNHFHSPHKAFRTIHVGGTNGKGSTSHMLAAILQSANYKVGLYTSPHLIDFGERIRVNGEKIRPQYVCDFVAKNKGIFNQIQPSFFEATMMMAFEYFKEEKVDVAIIEVGLGGRLDSTNIIAPDLSIITNISKDHVQYLGDTLEKIAFEKAGIIKEKTPVIIGENGNENIKNIFAETAKEKNAPIYFAEEYALRHSSYEKILKNAELKGFYQQKNIKTVLTGIDVLIDLGYSIKEENILVGTQNVCSLTGLMGRWQIIANNPLTIADTGHNEAGIAYVVQQLRELKANKIRIVFGMVNDKDIQAVLSLMPKEAIYYFCNAHIKRALPAKDLQNLAMKFDLKGKIFSNVKEALKQAQTEAESNDVVYIGGSNFVVAEGLQ